MTTDETVTTTIGTKVSRLAKATRGAGHVLGIASDNYHDFTTAGQDEVRPEDNPLPVALNGRVPVRVNMEGGPIAIGDAITLSSEPGVGTRATTSSLMVGIALEVLRRHLGILDRIGICPKPNIHRARSA